MIEHDESRTVRVYVHDALESGTTQDKADVLLAAWMYQATLARNERAGAPNGFAAEQARQVGLLQTLLALVRKATPDEAVDRFIAATEAADLIADGLTRLNGEQRPRFERAVRDAQCVQAIARDSALVDLLNALRHAFRDPDAADDDTGPDGAAV